MVYFMVSFCYIIKSKVNVELVHRIYSPIKEKSGFHYVAWHYTVTFACTLVSSYNVLGLLHQPSPLENKV